MFDFSRTFRGVNTDFFFYWKFIYSQFAQFDYGQQGYGDPNAYGGQRDQYVGSILTPDPSPAYDPNATGENYEDEPPLMEGKYCTINIKTYQ